MHIIEVIPLTNLPPQVPQLLSYFFAKPLLKGAVVEVSINNRKVPAVVVSSVSMEEQKISLKKSGFQLKKISAVISEEPKITDIQFKIALWLSRNYFSSLGLTFKTILPSFFANPKFPFSYPIIKLSKENQLFSPIIMLSGSREVLNNIKPEIKKILGQKKQVLIVVSEISIAKYFYDIIAGLYETSLIHSGISPKKNYREWRKISSGETEVIIGTRQSLFAPFSNLGLVVVEDPANEAYKSDMSPKYNTRDLAEKIAGIYSASLVFISQIPDINSYFLAKNNIYKIEDKRLSPKVDIRIENILNEIKTGNYSIFSRELKNNIEKYAQDNKKIIIFSTRKGYSTSLICENCRFYFKCPQCSVPLKIHRFPEEILMCHRCSSVHKIPDYCPNCNSYKLRSGGFAGSEKIKEELEFILKNKNIDKPIFIFDSSSVNNAKQESELVKKIEETKSFICIATQAIFSHRFNLSADFIGIANLDSLTTTPDFKTEEDLFRQFEKLLDFKPDKVIIQTYNPDSPLINSLKDRKYQEFYGKELQLRKLFSYPPFARLVKLSFFSPDKNKAGYEARVLNEKLKIAIVQRKLEENVKILGPSPAFVERERGMYIYNLILKLKPEFKVDEIIKFVPSSWSIDVDPKSIL